jgi:acyl-coenzyme A synthetase/AMP-(fatty) acid ligase
VRGDRIRFVGRSGETINVGGVKVHPLPVEELVSGVDGVELARAYARSNPITGQIVAVDVVPRPGVDHKLLERDVRAACAALPPAGRPQRIRFVDELDVEGHKIARRQRVANR